MAWWPGKSHVSFTPPFPLFPLFGWVVPKCSLPLAFVYMVLVLLFHSNNNPISYYCLPPQNKKKKYSFSWLQRWLKSHLHLNLASSLCQLTSTALPGSYPDFLRGNARPGLPALFYQTLWVAWMRKSSTFNELIDVKWQSTDSGNLFFSKTKQHMHDYCNTRPPCTRACPWLTRGWLCGVVWNPCIRLFSKRWPFPA